MATKLNATKRARGKRAAAPTAPTWRWIILVTVHGIDTHGHPLPMRSAHVDEADAIAAVRRHMQNAYCEVRELTPWYVELDGLLSATPATPLADLLRFWNDEGIRRAAGVRGAARIATISVDAVRFYDSPGK